MNKTHALVLKVDATSMTVLTDAGDFLTLPVSVPAPRKGQRLWITPQRRHYPTFLITAVAAAAIILAVLGGVWYRTPPPVALALALDINPSLVLNVDEDGSMVSMEPLNEDARRLRPIPAGTALADALSMLLRDAAQKGFLLPEREGVIVYSWLALRPGGHAIDKHSIMEQAVAHSGVNARLIPLLAQDEDWQSARQQGVSVNQVLIAREARARGKEIQFSDLQGAGLLQGLDAAGMLPARTPEPEAPPRSPMPGEAGSSTQEPGADGSGSAAPSRQIPAGQPEQPARAQQTPASPESARSTGKPTQPESTGQPVSEQEPKNVETKTGQPTVQTTEAESIQTQANTGRISTQEPVDSAQPGGQQATMETRTDQQTGQNATIQTRQIEPTTQGAGKTPESTGQQMDSHTTTQTQTNTGQQTIEQSSTTGAQAAGQQPSTETQTTEQQSSTTGAQATEQQPSTETQTTKQQSPTGTQADQQPAAQQPSRPSGR